jgi:hypothetical protein
LTQAQWLIRVWCALLSGLLNSLHPDEVDKFTGDVAKSQPKLSETAPCNRRLGGHAKGRKLEALQELHRLTYYTGFYFSIPGWKRSEATLRRSLTVFLVERKICSECWARKIVQELFNEGWLEISTYKEKLSVRVRTHEQWGSELRQSGCFWSQEGSVTGRKMQRSQNLEETKVSFSTEASSIPKTIESIDRTSVTTESKGLTAASIEKGLEETSNSRGSREQPDPSAHNQSGTKRPSVAGSRLPLQEEDVQNTSAISEFLRLASSDRAARYGRGLLLREGKELEKAKLLLGEHEAKEVADAYRLYLKNDDPYLRDKKHPFGLFASQIEQYLEPERGGEELVYICSECNAVEKFAQPRSGPITRRANGAPTFYTCPPCRRTEIAARNAEQAVLAEVDRATLEKWSRSFDQWAEILRQNRPNGYLLPGDNPEFHRELVSRLRDRSAKFGLIPHQETLDLMGSCIDDCRKRGIEVPDSFLEARHRQFLNDKSRKAYFAAKKAGEEAEKLLRDTSNHTG